MVRAVEAGARGGVTVAGEKLHEAPDGNPEQLKETVELNPLAGVTVTVVAALSPAVTVIDAGLALTAKVGRSLMV